MKQQDIIARGADGYYHPANEGEVIALIQYAVANGLQIRTRGAAHSTAWSIFTDPVDGKPENKITVVEPPAGDNMNVAMDNMFALTWIDEAAGIVEAEAGIHLGHDPNDPFNKSTLENSLLYQIYLKGWAINDLGGITHQTLSGFVGTGSAGGSLVYSLDNVIGFRVVDGTGNASWIEKGDEIFDAMQLSVGLLGIVTKVRLQLAPMYNIYGQEVTTPVTKAGCPIDLFGPGDAKKPSMRRFLEMTPYSRMMWWPQKEAERVTIWQAVRSPAAQPEAFTPVPYQEFAPDFFGQTEQLLAAMLFTLLGNRGISETFPLLFQNYGYYHANLVSMWNRKIGEIGAQILAGMATLLIAIILFVPLLFFTLFPAVIRALFPYVLPIFEGMTKPGQPTQFQDYYWRSLCMDNTADDNLLGTEFTELWIPIQYTERVMNLMQDMFDKKGVVATGYYSTEIYGGATSSAWMAPSYTDGQDEYKDGCVRLDIFWYRNNDSDPYVKHGFFEQYWNLLLANNIPFRFHWGKFVPGYDFPFWAKHYRDSLPKLADFLAVRARRDPHNVFFTTYWQERLTGAALQE